MKLKFFFAALMLMAGSAHAQSTGSVFIEDLTWMEVRDRIAQGANIALVPVGATEQSGPQMANGKHNSIMRFAAGDIARKIGGTLVAPVIPYSPTGRIFPPEGNMQFAGTLSMRSETLAMVLTDVANSLKQHGFKLICLIGDNAGSQAVQQQVADDLNSEWASDGVQVLNVSDYADLEAQNAWAMSNGAMASNPVAHAGMAETSELMAVSPQQVRNALLGAYGDNDYSKTGAAGDATQSNAAFGRGILGVKVSAAIKQIKQAAARGE